MPLFRKYETTIIYFLFPTKSCSFPGVYDTSDPFSSILTFAVIAEYVPSSFHFLDFNFIFIKSVVADSIAFLAAAVLVASFPSTLEPVSYTHLDVYKRQTFRFFIVIFFFV